MKLSSIDGLVLAVVGALFVDLSFGSYQTNWLGLIVGVLLMLWGVGMVVRSLW